MPRYRMTMKDRLYQYLIEKSDRLDGYYETLRSNFRILDADELDYTELLIARVRRELMREVVQEIILLTKK